MTLDKLPAALFAASFFSALPLWFLSTLEGPVRFSGGGVPWRCTVSRWVFFETKTATYEPVKVSVEVRGVGGRGGARARQSRVMMQLPQGSVVAATAWSSSDDNERAADELENARQRQRTVVVDRPAGGTFWSTVFLVLLFAGVGVFLVSASGTPPTQQRSHSTRRS
jgi:hypothetical protein